MHMPIKAVDLRRYYTVGGITVKALDGVSLDIADGEYVTICGASGSGKSTLMNILGCLDSPTSGSYILDGEEVPKMDDSQLSRIRGSRIGFVFQSFNLIPTLTARENVELPLMYRGVPRKQRREAALEALEQVGLAERADHRPSEMSGGQQQRTAIARAIAARPSLILADEPCGNLDSRSGRIICEILEALHLCGKTIVMITHDENAARHAERLIRIADGKIAGA
ncbi:MAG TPA: macrolide ABC transporter ATP-binding protein [Ruminococcaceae bacterium]|nr:macrolide ABC transporter ATP-binding protein [Oscillospiraceae bacterium]